MDVKQWMVEQNVSASAYDADELVHSFLSEMEAGLAGNESSLAMIPAFVTGEGEVTPGRAVAVIDAGGTNLRVCLVAFDEKGAAQVSGFSKQPMPGRKEEISAATFYEVLVSALEPFKDQFEAIGFCFSYPATILPDLDGQLVKWTKEVKIPELVGEKVGAGLIAALDARGITGKKIVLLNDTVATLLAGMSYGKQFDASSYIGFILGTGTNTAYVEQNEAIGKLEGLKAGASQAINVESGAFAAFERGPVDVALDARSEFPGGHVFEKLLSGVYMGSLTLGLLKALAEEGGLSEAGAEKVRAMDDLYIIDIDNLASDNGRDVGELADEAFSEADRVVMKQVFEGIVERASLLTAVNIAAAVIKGGKGTDPAHPVCVNIDGSTYYMTGGMEEQVQAYLKPMLERRGLHIRCVRVDDAPVVGAAIAALTSF